MTRQLIQSGCDSTVRVIELICRFSSIMLLHYLCTAACQQQRTRACIVQCTREQTHLLPLVFAKPPFWPAFSFSAFSAAASSFFFLQYRALQRVGGAVLGTAAELQRGRTLIQTSFTQSVRSYF